MSEQRADEAAAPPPAGDRGLPYLPAIDGLRALALAAVLLDHGGVAAVVGGHFGVTVFFVLSGFLVAALLVREHQQHGAVHLGAFWARRARRLVPGSLVFVAFVAAYVAFGAASVPSTVVGDGLASLTWVANWRFVLTDRSYGDLFVDPTPFAHVWSLAVEEQFYLALPIVAALSFRARRHAIAVFAGCLAVAVVGSTASMWVSYARGADPWRVYYGTDTRLAELAVGALLALALLRGGELVVLPARAARSVTVTAFLAIAAIGALMTRWSTEDAATYRGGFLLVALLSAIVVTACTQAGSTLARVLSVDPLPQLGRLTYGAYLFHWPVFLWLDEASTRLEGTALLMIRIATTLGLAAASLVFVERPVRLWRVPRPLPALAWANGSIAVASVLVAVAIGFPMADASQLASGQVVSAPPAQVVPTEPGPRSPAVGRRSAPAEAASAGNGEAAGSVGDSRRHVRSAAPAPVTPTASVPPQPPATTSTTTQTGGGGLRVAVVGDSLAANLGGGLTRWAAGRTDIVVYDLAIGGCPISRGGTRRFGNGHSFPIDRACSWWEDESHERRKNLERFDADIVVVEDALNEVVDRKLPEWTDYRRVGDPRFDAWLLSEYREAAEVFSSGGATVVYANAPCGDWARLAEWGSIEDIEHRVEALNRIYENVVGATTRVADLYERICPGGAYRDDVEGVENGRPDGCHLSDLAAERLAERWLVPFLKEVGRATSAPL